MAVMKKLSMARDQIAKNLNEIPIKWGRFIDKNMQEQKVIFFGHEKAIYGTDGDRLDEKLIKIENGISDAFFEEKDYATGDYCIYLNSLYKFTTPKPAGPWDGTAVIPVSLAGEMAGVKGEVKNIDNNIKLRCVPWYTVAYNASNKENAMNMINNPTILTGNYTSPYAVIFIDSIGDSMFGGGESCIVGYTYGTNLYGTQILLKHSNSNIKIRRKVSGVWTELETPQ